MAKIEFPSIIVNLSNFIADKAQESIEFPISVNFSHQEDRFSLTKPIKGKVTVEKYQEELQFHFKLQTEMTLVCDRCLSTINKKLKLNFKRLGTFSSASDDEIKMTQQSHPKPEFDEGVRISSDNLVNLFVPIRQEILSIVPAKILCKKTCRGLCLVCGVNLNNKICKHSK
jgi:uncharacterized protein